MTKKILGVNFDKTINRLAKPSVFDRLVKEVDTHDIPSKYIDHILVQYHDGTVSEFAGDDIMLPVPIGKHELTSNGDGMYKDMRDIKIFINTGILEVDINELVEQFLGPYC